MIDCRIGVKQNGVRHAGSPELEEEGGRRVGPSHAVRRVDLVDNV
jgi:hypothetical protein